MRRKLVRSALVAQLCFIVHFATHAQQSTPPSSEDYQKFEAVRAFLQARNALDYAVSGARSIDEGRYVELGGIDQWITIRGENRDNPVLLFLHGGPGDATNPWAYAIFRTWLPHFTVVQWDQRGTGRTLGRNGPSVASTITLERMVADGIELAELLRESLGKDKVIVVGHSWGSLLAVLMVKSRPELFHAYVGTGQVADGPRNFAVAYDELLKKAEVLGERRAVDELRAIGRPPFKDARSFARQRKWANQFEGADRFVATMLGLGYFAPGYSLRDVHDWLDGQQLTADRLVPLTAQLDLEDLSGRFEVPVFVIHGAEDFTTPTSLAREFVDRVRAPRKELLLIEGGHFAVFTAPETFLRELVQHVRPLAITL
jgi:pimeloyl-ACP methyl ester carboxylesterase